MANKKATAATKTYRVLSPIAVGKGEVLSPGTAEDGSDADTIELTDEEAGHLAGYVQLIPAAAAPKE
jgi:hypothetical protein